MRAWPEFAQNSHRLLKCWLSVKLCCLIRRLQQVFTDATLTQGGMHLPPVEGEGGEAEEYGNSLPTFLFGTAVLGMQTGVTELGSLLFCWAGLCHFPKSLRELQAHCMAVVLDNLGRVGSEGR